MKTIARSALVAALALAAVPGQALAQGYYGPFGQPQEDYGPGVTVSGAGLARVKAPAKLTEDSVRQAIDQARPKAVTRAVADARQRAGSIATAMGISLGSARAVELNPGFREREPCRRSRRTQELRCTVPSFTTASASVTFEIVGGAGTTDGARELSAAGTGSAPVDAKRRISPAIRAALFAARLEATPKAASRARANVELAAQGAGLTLGAPFSVVEQLSPYGYDPLLGAFSPGTYCGNVTRGVVVRGNSESGGGRRVVRRIRVRRCFAPRTLQVSFDATYLAQG
ncbi:MAG TPA: SIMPL domain-containing protein [Thermoleophilaceae bacterium]|nr:SIMPL domain-containing protein [Thermoleophilaceae bacterium]